jgi:hypothetical protein
LTGFEVLESAGTDVRLSTGANTEGVGVTTLSWVPPTFNEELGAVRQSFVDVAAESDVSVATKFVPNTLLATTTEPDPAKVYPSRVGVTV